MLADRKRLTVDLTMQIRGGPTKITASDGQGFRIEMSTPNGSNDEFDQVKKGDVVWLTIERHITP